MACNRKPFHWQQVSDVEAVMEPFAAECNWPTCGGEGVEGGNNVRTQRGNRITMRMDYAWVMWDGCRSLHCIEHKTVILVHYFFFFNFYSIPILACGGSEAYRRMPLNVMYNDTFGWLSLSNSLYFNVYKIWGGRRTDMVWTPKPHTCWTRARNQLQILFTVRERQQNSGTRLWLL